MFAELQHLHFTDRFIRSTCVLSSTRFFFGNGKDRGRAYDIITLAPPAPGNRFCLADTSSPVACKLPGQEHYSLCYPASTQLILQD